MIKAKAKGENQNTQQQDQLYIYILLVSFVLRMCIGNFGIFQSNKINCFVQYFVLAAFLTDGKIAFVE